MMSFADVLTYVKACANLLAVPLDEARAERVAQHLQRTSAMADLLDAVDMQPHDEPAELYCPAPFPGSASAGGAP